VYHGHAVDEQEQVASAVGQYAFAPLKLRLAHYLVVALAARYLQSVIDREAYLLAQVCGVVGVVSCDVGGLSVDETIESHRRFQVLYPLNDLAHLALRERLVVQAVFAAVVSEKEEVIDEPITVDGTEYRMTCVSMGNPHAVVFIDQDVKEFPLETVGVKFENHERFPKRVNTEFVNVLDRHTAQMRVWERGSGETLACGTGACAVAVACALNGLTEDEVTVKLLGGDLQIKWDREKNTVYMTGPAEVVFDGEWK